MPLPQQVINQLGREPAKTPGWSSGILIFSAALMVIVLVIYFGLTMAYEPYLNSQVTTINGQISALSQSIPSAEQTQLISFYSQVSNLRSLLQKHVAFSQFLEWLQQQTEANVYYSQFTFSSGTQITITGSAETEADVNQQLAIFAASPEVQNMAVSSVGLASNNAWQFTVSLIMKPAIFTSQFSQAPAPTASAPVTTASTTTQ